MKDTILSTLRRIEREQNVRVIYAVESGSRAWGFASPDSDYDVRYIYVRRPEDYVRVDEMRDTIEGPLDDVLDFSGWDIRKALQLLRKTNPSLMEWVHSPIVYLETPEWQGVKAAVPACFSVRAEMHHYLAMAQENWKTIAPTATPRLKRYLYLLRPLLCALWLERYGTMPPVRFDALAEAMLPEVLRPAVGDLLERKKAMGEKGCVSRIDAVDAWYLQESERLRAHCDGLAPTHTSPDGLSALLRSVIRGAWEA